MGFLDNIKEKVQNWKEVQEEKREFQKLVEQETLPIRRAAYLEQKKRQAIEEGREIAKKEKKIQEKKEKENFGIGINTENYFKSNKSGGKNEWFHN